MQAWFNAKETHSVAEYSPTGVNRHGEEKGCVQNKCVCTPWRAFFVAFGVGFVCAFDVGCQEQTTKNGQRPNGLRIDQRIVVVRKRASEVCTERDEVKKVQDFHPVEVVQDDLGEVEAKARRYGADHLHEAKEKLEGHVAVVQELECLLRVFRQAHGDEDHSGNCDSENDP